MLASLLRIILLTATLKILERGLDKGPIIYIEEQKKISAFFKNLDNLITLHQRTCEKYKKIKQGMMEELLSGKIRLV